MSAVVAAAGHPSVLPLYHDEIDDADMPFLNDSNAADTIGSRGPLTR